MLFSGCLAKPRLRAARTLGELHFSHPLMLHRSMVDQIRVALIDDERAVLDALQRYLARQGVSASCFHAAKEFLAALDRREPFDCIVSDVRMPGMSGLDLMQHLNRRGTGRP